jgi:anti-sigma factor RsiW
MSKIPVACAAYEEDLSALLDGELAAEREEEIRAHVAGCPRCGPRLAELERVDALLASTPLPALRPGLRERLEVRLRQEERREEAESRGRKAGRLGPPPARRWLARPAWGIAAAAAAALALYLTVRSDGPGLPAATTPAPEFAQQPALPGIPQGSPAPKASPAPAAPEASPEPAAPRFAQAPAVEPSPPGAEGPEEAVAAGGEGQIDIDGISDEELAMILEIETLEDLDVIANIDLLEELVALEEGA